MEQKQACNPKSILHSCFAHNCFLSGSEPQKTIFIAFLSFWFNLT